MVLRTAVSRFKYLTVWADQGNKRSKRRTAFIILQCTIDETWNDGKNDSMPMLWMMKDKCCWNGKPTVSFSRAWQTKFIHRMRLWSIRISRRMKSIPKTSSKSLFSLDGYRFRISCRRASIVYLERYNTRTQLTNIFIYISTFGKYFIFHQQFCIWIKPHSKIKSSVKYLSYIFRKGFRCKLTKVLYIGSNLSLNFEEGKKKKHKRINKQKTEEK